MRPTQNWKMTTKEVEAGTDVIKEFAIPRLVNLNLDPREEHALSYQYQHFWVRFALGKVMTDYLASLQAFPPIRPGTADPYQPPPAPKLMK